MFNLSLPELLVIGAAGLLVFGPKRLPELAKSLGKGIRDFKKAMEGEEDDKQAPAPSLPPVVQSPVAPTEARTMEKVPVPNGSSDTVEKTL